MTIIHGIAWLRPGPFEPLGSENICRIAPVAKFSGYYYFAWSSVDPCLCLLASRIGASSKNVHMAVNLDAGSLEDAQAPVPLEHIFTPVILNAGSLEVSLEHVLGNEAPKAGIFQWNLRFRTAIPCPELTSHPFTPVKISSLHRSDELALFAARLFAARIKNRGDWMVSQLLSSGLVALGSCNSWSSCNPIEFWDTSAVRLLHTIKTETPGPATPRYNMAFNANGSLLYFDNGYESSLEIWGVPASGA